MEDENETIPDKPEGTVDEEENEKLEEDAEENEREEEEMEVESEEEDDDEKSKTSKDKEEIDPRITMLEDILIKAIKIKPDKFQRLMANPDLGGLVLKFLNNREEKIMLFNLSPAQAFMVFLEHQPNLKSKIMYFIRTAPEKVTVENFFELLQIGEMSSQPLDELQVIVQDMLLPILSNPQNTKNWPQFAVDDVIRHVHEMSNKIYVLKGRMKGQILLPMPLGIERIDKAIEKFYVTRGQDQDLLLKSAIEDIFIEWSKLITETLEIRSSIAFLDDKQPTPMEEITFWNKRLQNLEGIFGQLRDDRVKKMATYLELCQSIYLKCFKDLFNNVVSGLTECRDICVYLKPLVTYFDLLDSTEFYECGQYLHRLWHVICLVWSNSSYYRTSPKIIVLLREICNLLIHSCSKTLDPATLFQGEVEDCIKNIEKSLTVFSLHLELFFEYKDKIHTYFPSDVDPKLWIFHHKIVFSRYIRFIRRLENILELFKTTDDFLKLEKLVFGGIMGRELTAKIEKMFEDFSVTYNYFTGIAYDPLDPEEEQFDKDYANFKKQILHYDNSLASILTLAFEACITTEAIYKFFNICGTILDRPIIHNELFPKYTNIYKLLHKELDKIKELFDKAMDLYKNGHLTVDKNFPPVAGTILFLRKLDNRITPQINVFKQLNPKLVEEGEGEHALKKHQQMRELMNKFESKIFNQWASVVGNQIETNLAKPLKTRDKLNFLSLNFDPQLVAALREARYLKELNKEGIPEVALKLNERAEELYQWIYHLNLIVKWYNDLRRISRPAEYIMIEHEIEAIDSIIDIALEILDWNMPNSWDYIMYVFNKLEDVYKRVRGAQENLDKIIEILEPFTKKSLFERLLDEKDDKEEVDEYEDSEEDEGAKLFPIEIIIEAKGLIILSDREQRVEKRYNELQEISELINDLKIENYNYFLNIKPEPEVSEDEPDTDEDEIMEAQVKEDEAEYTKEELERIAEETAQRRADRLQRNEAREIRREERAQREEERLQYANLSPQEKRLFLIEKHNVQEEEAADAAEEEEMKENKVTRETAGAGAGAGAGAEAAEDKRGKKKKKKKDEADDILENKNPLWPPPAIQPPEPQYLPTVPREGEDEPFLLSQTGLEEEISEHEEEEPVPFDFAYATAMEDKWVVYLTFLDQVVQDYLRKAVQCSLDFLERETNAKLKRPPLFLIDLALHEPHIVYVPTLVTKDPGECFYGLIWSLLKNITMMALQVKRIYHIDPEFENYYKSVKRDPDIKNIRRGIKQRTRDAMYSAVAYADKYKVHSYLWLTDKQIYLSQFLEYSRPLTPNDLALIEKKNPENPGPPKCKPTIEKFKEMIDFYNDLHTQLESIELEHTIHQWLKINVRGFRESVLEAVYKWRNLFIDYLSDRIIDSIEELYKFIDESLEILSQPVLEDDYDALLKCMGCLFKVRERQVATDLMFEPLWEIIDLLKTYDVYFDEELVLKKLMALPEYWEKCKKVAATVKNQITPLIQKEAGLIVKRQGLFMIRQTLFRKTFLESELFRVNCIDVYFKLDEVNKGLISLEKILDPINESCAFFDVSIVEFKDLNLARRELKNLKLIWDYFLVIQSCIEEWKKTPWKKIDVESMENECKKFVKELKQLDKDIRNWELYANGETVLKNLLTSLRAVSELQNPAIRDRHWKELMEATKVKFQMDDKTTLADLLVLKLHEYEEEVKFIVDKSVKEMAMEKILHEINNVWGTMEFEYDTHRRTNLKLLHPSEELIETLEEHQVALQNMLSSKYIAYFLEEVSHWQQKLSYSDQIISIWFEVQRTWSHLEAIFIGSEDIRSQLPEDSRRFDTIDRTFKENLGEINKASNVIKTTNRPGLYEKLEHIQTELALCEKALSEYLETKRLAFPRFYFISSADLLDILSNGNQPELVCRHLTKLFDSINKLKFDTQGSKFAKGMFAKDGEYTDLYGGCECSGKVERWLNNVIEAMRRTIRYLLSVAITDYADKVREKWLFDHIAQPALIASQIWWSTEVNYAFTKFEEGYENSIKDYSKKQITQLNALIIMLCGDLSAGDRQKIMTICTIDVHARDVIIQLITNRIETASAFQWQAQLRHRWDFRQKDCFCNICDAQFRYQYEYLGNTPRLVITPLTDRCYITLTQSLHLVMGSAPAGPAGTGKTETTKDLGRAMGLMVYVYNCSEQMDYQSCGNIYKGLAQTGAWGCFDEFNRIAIEVLSVVAVQVKSILDALKLKKTSFNFLGEHITLQNTIGLFITMNPGYAGRTELPENLKALFRPCAMVVPDFALICEIMLVAEGFQEARLLARKFITLYTLCRELLSKQDHYDWGLRAIKSVLVVAGALKRSDRLRPEDQVLMRALRDFNIPKIITDDLPVFMDLISDLFPALDVPRKRDPALEKDIQGAAVDLMLQPEDKFILKIVQLQELLDVRHSVFIVGLTGTGKSQVWKTLFRTYQNQKRKPHYNDLNPKAVTNDELFGVINPTTREWKDGLFSILIRDQTTLTGDGPKWMVMDGDIDPMWIESLNSVMDDNKVLTLASNERIALTPCMRLLFEIASLRTATPATVSRAGILYINVQDVGWAPNIASWLAKRDNANDKAILGPLFDRYVPNCLEALKSKFKKITPVAPIAHIMMLCSLLDCLIHPRNLPTDCPKEWYEIYFVFCAVWAFGSSIFRDQIADYRIEFSKWWVSEFRAVRFPTTDTVFHYFIDPETKEFLPWGELVQEFKLDYDIPLNATIVDTSETTRIRYFIDLLIENRNPIMLVGIAGVGKTVIINSKLSSLSENYVVQNIPFNFYTTSEMLQRILEKSLEKKAGRNYGPPGSKQMIYFIDDMNMPEVDLYGTVQPHTLIRQHLDYNHWYDRTKLTLKDIHNCQYISCMNPTAGSFTINPRLQRHFCVFAVSFPSMEPLTKIYTSILMEHLKMPENKFQSNLEKIVPNLANAAISFHSKISTILLPSVTKFHYVFNLRDLSNVFQGILFSSAETAQNQVMLCRLWAHEITRVYCDKMVDFNDIDTCNKLLLDSFSKAGINEIKDEEVFVSPLIFSHFASGLGESKYLTIKTWDDLSRLLEEALSQYNDLVSAMNLVLFEDAMYHVCRINRILEAPRGNALLVGVGGSGKQSLSRLASFISSLEVFQIQFRKGYGLNDLRMDLAGIYFKAGVKSIGMSFLMSDAQVAEERFLVLINDMLASGEIPDLFVDDEIENITGLVRNEVKGAGIMDSKENCWKFFINRIRTLIKVILCFSPVGSTLRIRGRKFPALINCTAIDWFHEWPQVALESVSYRFLSEIESLPKSLTSTVSLFMAYVHMSVNDISASYLANERRYNYTTPKSFLEQIALYSKLLTEKTNYNKDRISRLVNGLDKLASTSSQVAGLKETLAVQEVVVKEKNEAADVLIQVVGVEAEKVSKEKQFAAEEEKKVRAIEEDVSVKQKVCEVDLKKAEPALIAAQEALNTLNKNNLTELKSFGAPPEAVVNVCTAVLIMFSKKGKLPKDRSWKACKTLMGDANRFLESLIKYDKEHIHPSIISAVLKYTKNPEFDPEKVMKKSQAAAGICAWVLNIIKFYDVFLFVEPKRRALNAANAELSSARQRLEFLKEKITSLEEKLSVLTANFEQAVAVKLKCQAEADATALTIDLANRLVGGLTSENVRWRQLVSNYKEAGKTLPGDILMITAFISYVGCFTRQYRMDLLHKFWFPKIQSLEPKIDLSENLDPLGLLTDDAQIAKWNNEGLPSDRMSAENATILSNSARWPLMIDPQLQGLKWIKTRYGEDLKVIRLTQKNYMDVIENAVSEGSIVLLEYIGETVDAVLDPLLGRVLIHKGRAIKIGDHDVDYNVDFRLILQTKLANPHYKPEMQALTTLINFTVTRDGLEEQLLAEVVKTERPDLEMLKSNLTTQQNTFKITLKKCEDDLLMRLSSAGDNILSDASIVYNLETTKKTADEVEIKVEEAKETTIKIDQAREMYRRVANRASLIYFILNELSKINPLYQFSLKAFSVVFKKAIVNTPDTEDVSLRVTNLIDQITYSTFLYTSRGLFECDKLIFLSHMCLQVLLSSKEIEHEELDFLLRYPFQPGLTSPHDFITNIGWGGIKALTSLPDMQNLERDIEGSLKRWKNFVESETPERDKFPGEYKNKTPLQKLCMMRALRPDRMVYAMRVFIEEKFGTKYAEGRSIEFSKTYEETDNKTPVFFILSPGVDPLKDVERLGKTFGFGIESNNLHNVALGQGQEPVAEDAMDQAAEFGHWVIVQNIHLIHAWLPILEKKLEINCENSHENYRLFMSAEPPADKTVHIIPQGILESSIKITNEPPSGMFANLHKALDIFNQDTLEMCTKESEFKVILFALCYFHAVVNERKKFGAQGWNRKYPFNNGDLSISVNVLYNYLENSAKVPWENLRYLFGEIMYGGHITDDWDRRLCRTYLEVYMCPELVDGELNLAPGFPSPPNSDYEGYHKYIDHALPGESPYLCGLHPNAEIGYLTSSAEHLFRIIFELQPRDLGAAVGVIVSREDKVKAALEDILDKVPPMFNVAEIMSRVENRTPYIIVAFQECERMNSLFHEIYTSLRELDLGLKGELTISSEMEVLEENLFMDLVPESWTKLAYPSQLGLGSWYQDLQLRLRELESWVTDFQLPAAVWLAGFFNPQSFLTAIMQSTARKNEWPLDKMCLQCDVTKKEKEEFTAPPREGAYIHSLIMEGARWDTIVGGIVDANLGELLPILPVIYVKAITQDKQDLRNIYECPLYKTRERGITFVWTFNLKTKDKPSKWTLAGVALILTA